MIVGDPYVFAVMMDVVKEWNEEGAISDFNNGTLYVSIDGTFFFTEVVTATLNVEVPRLIDTFTLSKPKVNMDFYNMEKEEAFVEIYKVTYPDWDLDAYDWDNGPDNDYSYTITPYQLSDMGYYMFMVSNGEQNRILAAEVPYIREESKAVLDHLTVLEAYISNQQLQEMVDTLEDYLRQISKDRR